MRGGQLHLFVRQQTLWGYLILIDSEVAYDTVCPDSVVTLIKLSAQVPQNKDFLSLVMITPLCQNRLAPAAIWTSAGTRRGYTSKKDCSEKYGVNSFGVG